MACSPFAHAVNRLPRDEQVAEQDQEGLDRRELDAAIFRRQRRAEKVFQSHAAEEMIEDGQRAHSGRTQHILAGAGNVLGRRLGRRTCRLGRSRRLSGHGLGFLPGCMRTACRLRLEAAPCDRNMAKTSSSSQEGNVQFGQESRVCATRTGTYDEDHRRKFCAARFTSMVRFVSDFCLLPRIEVDIASACGRREDSTWAWTPVLAHSQPKANTGPSPCAAVEPSCPARKFEDITLQICGTCGLRNAL